MLPHTRILLTTPYDLNVPGGVNNQLWGLYAYLKSTTGARVKLIGPASDAGAFTDPDVLIVGKVFRLNMNGAVSNLTFDLTIRNRVRDFMRAFDPHIVHFQELFAPVLNNYVLRFSRAVNVATFHTNGMNRIGYTLAWPYLRYQVQRMDTRIAVSEAAKAYVARLFPGHYHIVPNAIDLGRIPDAGERGVSGGKHVLLFVGRVTESRKGFRHLLNAYAMLESRYPGRYRLVVAGADDGAWRREARGDVRWLGRVPEERLHAVYRDCDVVCAPSTGGESFGVVLLEAFAHGKPVVGFRIDGYTELVGDSPAALLTPNRNEAALAEAVHRVCSDADLYHRMRRAARALARTYDWSSVGKRITALYEQALHRRHAAMTP